MPGRRRRGGRGCGGHDGHGLVQGQRLDGRPCWPLGVSARMATLRVTRSLASACRMARLSARCPIETAAVEYPAAMAARAWRTSAAVRSRGWRGPMTFRIGARGLWVLVAVLAEGPWSRGASQALGGWA